MLVLPSERTLRDYSNVIKSEGGFSIDIIHQLFDEARKGQRQHSLSLTVSTYMHVSFKRVLALYSLYTLFETVYPWSLLTLLDL